MASNLFSARMNPELLARLQRRSELEGTNRSRLAERYVEEGLRMDEHAGIVFRPSWSGRQAALAGGPKITSVVMVAQGYGSKGEKLVADLTDHFMLTPQQIRTALAYYESYPSEVDEWLRVNDEESEEAYAAWQKEQAAKT